jgi:hypothetical protein
VCVQVPRCYWPKTSQQGSIKWRPCWSAIKPVRITFSHIVCFSRLIDINLGFLTEGKLAAILIITSSWGSQRAGHSPRIKLFFWRHCRGEKWKTSARGVFAHTSFTLLLFCFTLFILPASFYIKNPKKLESLVVVISLLLVYHAIP